MAKLIIFLLFLVGCHKEEKITVTFWHVMSGPLGKRLDEMIADFNSSHPWGVIKSVHMGSYDVLAQKLMGAISSNTPPVISQMYGSWADQFFEAGYLQPLQEFIDQDSQFNLQDFYPVFIDDNTYDSILVTLPFNKSVPVFYYNKEIFDSLGIEDFPKNWQEFREVCIQIRRLKIWPTSWPIDAWYFSTMVYQENGQLYDELNKKPLFNAAPGLVVLEYLISLIRDSLFNLNPGFQRQDEFLSGNVAIIPASIVSWAFMKGRPPFEMGVAPFPQGRKKTVVIAGTNIGMFKNISKDQKRLAWQFIKWFLEPENQLRWTQASYYLPVSHSTTRLPGFQKFLSENHGYDKIIEQLEFACTEPKSKDWFAGRIYLNEALEEALRLERTPAAALNNAAKRMLVDLE